MSTQSARTVTFQRASCVDERKKNTCRSVSIVWRCRTTSNIDDVSSRSGFAWMRAELGLRPAPSISTDSPVHESASFWRSLRLRPSTQQRLWHSAARWRVSVSASWLPPQEVRYLPSSNYNFGSSDDAGACTTHTDCWLCVWIRGTWLAPAPTGERNNRYPPVSYLLRDSKPLEAGLPRW